MSDILESCEAIGAAIHGMDLAAYQATRLVRSSVEREFIIIGEAVAALARRTGNLLSDHSSAADRRFSESVDP